LPSRLVGEALFGGAFPLFAIMELFFPGELFGRPAPPPGFAGDFFTSRSAAVIVFTRLPPTDCDRRRTTWTLRLLLVKLLFRRGNDRGVLGALSSCGSESFDGFGLNSLLRAEEGPAIWHLSSIVGKSSMSSEKEGNVGEGEKRCRSPVLVVYIIFSSVDRNAPPTFGVKLTCVSQRRPPKRHPPCHEFIDAVAHYS